MTETFKLVSRRRRTHFFATPVPLPNPAAVKLLGAKTPIDLLGKALLDCVDATYRDLVEEHFRQALEGMDGPLLEHRLVTLDNKLIQVERPSPCKEEMNPHTIP